MSELDQALTVLARALNGMIRKAIREELTLRESEPRQAGTIHPRSEWMTTEMVAARLGISEVTLYSWRASAKGPPYTKIGRLIRYKTAHVDSWAEERLIRQHPSKAVRSR